MSAYSDLILSRNPRAYWRLGEASGTTMIDASGNGHSGAYTGAHTLGQPGLIAGDANTCIDLAGTNLAGGYGSASVPAQSSTFGVEFWFVADALRYQSAFSQMTGTGDGWLLKFRNQGDVWLRRWSAGSSNWATFVGAYTTGVLTHMAFVYEAGTVKFYKNGVLVTTTTLVGTIGAGTTALVGVAGDVSGETFDGRLDEVVLYDGTVPTAAQFAEHYDMGINGPPASGLSLLLRRRRAAY